MHEGKFGKMSEEEMAAAVGEEEGAAPLNPEAFESKEAKKSGAEKSRAKMEKQKAKEEQLQRLSRIVPDAAREMLDSIALSPGLEDQFFSAHIANIAKTGHISKKKAYELLVAALEETLSKSDNKKMVARLHKVIDDFEG